MLTIRPLCVDDIPKLQEISLNRGKREAQFWAYTTLVAVLDDEIVGYAQHAITPDGQLHSYPIRIKPEAKGKGVGRQLLEMQEQVARLVEAKMHFYAIDDTADAVMGSLLEKMGMHLCQQHDNVRLYVKTL